MKIQSKASLKREQQRESLKTIEFRRQIIVFLEGKHPEVIYAIKRDLACMTSMPFYKNRPEKIKITLSNKDLLVEYMNTFIKHDDNEFIIKLIKSLNKNQAQTIRKIAPKIGNKSEIWEHAIPAKIITDELIKMAINKDLTGLLKILNIYEQAGQRGITKEQDNLLSKFKSKMPEGWDWRNEYVDPLARHKEIGIEYQ